MLVRNGNVTEIIVGGKKYGACGTGAFDVPSAAVKALGAAIAQIGRWKDPQLNFMIGEEPERCGLVIIGKRLYAVQPGSGKMEAVDRRAMGLREDAQVEEVVFRLCDEIAGDIDEEKAAQWACAILPGTEESTRVMRKKYVRNLLEGVLGLVNACVTAEKRFRMPAADREVSMIDREISAARSALEAATRRKETVV